MKCKHSHYTEIYHKFKSPCIVNVIKVCRLEWLGNVVRMGGKRSIKKLWKANQEEGEERKTKTKQDG
jgi:hypothetical protein